MHTSRMLGSGVAVLGLCAAAACSAQAPVEEGAASAPAAETLAVAARFGVQSRWRVPEGALPVRSAQGFSVFAARSGLSLATLPLRSDAAVRVRDTERGMEVAFSLKGARSVQGAVGNGVVVYENGYGYGDHVFVVPTGDGVEDWVLLRKPRSALRYHLDLGTAAGLRLLENTLEFLDASGAPRLRVRPPEVVDRYGMHHAARLAVDGCRVDTSPAPPFGRALTPPGGRTCTLSVELDVAAESYPVLVDPAWQLTGNMATARRKHAMVTLPSGVVLVTGGQTSKVGLAATSAAEYYDKGVFSTAPSMVEEREGHSMNVVSDVVLVLGGKSLAKFTGEHLDLKQATPSWVGVATGARTEHATAVFKGEVWFCGGQDPLLSTALNTCESFEPTKKVLTKQAALKTARKQHNMVALSTELFVMGGTTAGLTEAMSDVERLADPKVGWTAGAPMLNKRAQARAMAYTATQILVTGGIGPGGAWNTAESWDPYSKSVFTWVPAGVMAQARSNHNMVGLADGSALLVGGGSTIAELWKKGTIQAVSPMNLTRYESAGALLASGDEVLISGGYAGPVIQTSAEVWKLGELGDPCSVNADCKAGQCVEGVCCNTACDQGCTSCLAVSTGLSDGTCGPKLKGLADSSCVDKGPGACSTNGLCDGAGGCDVYPVGTVCQSATCFNSGDGASWQECTGPGACETEKKQSCGTFGCAGGVCATACTTSAECAKTGFCDKGTCAPRSANGSKCSTGEECDSTLCVDGVCCNAACGGQCEACNEPGSEGVCVPVAGAPRGGKPACDGPTSASAPCTARRCDGIARDSCVGFAESTVVCSPATCSAGVQSFEQACDGAGACKPVQTKDCAPYACGGDSCRTDCSAEADCATGARCENGKCVAGATCDGDHTVTGENGQVEDCSPYRCSADGKCLGQCNTLDDCVSGSLCDSNKQCVSPTEEPADDSACGCRTPGSSAPRAPAALLLLMLGLISRRRLRTMRV